MRFTRTVICPAIICIALACANDALAISQTLLDAIPRDHLVYVAADSSSNGESDAPAPSPLISIGADLVHRFGGPRVSQGSAGVAADTLASLAFLKQFPFTIVVTDASAKKIGRDSFRLNDLQAAAIIQTNGDNAAITHHLQDLLTRWTSQDSARVTSKGEYNTRVYTLEDDRLPKWCVIRWAAVGRFYVVAIGRQGFNEAAQSILRSTERALDETKLKHWRELLGSASAHFECQFNHEAIRNALAPVMLGRPKEVLAELGFADCQRSMWTIGKSNRAVLCKHLMIAGDQETLQTISSEAYGEYLKIIPPTASQYTLLRCNLRDMAMHASSAYLASRRAKFRESLRSAWKNFERQAGISVQRDILDQLGDEILIHDDPPHPLKLPLLCTIVIPISGDPALVSRALDALLNQVNTQMRGSQANPSASKSKLVPRFIKSDDGIWAFSFGFAGPSVTIADRYIVISHSPTACRQSRAHILAVKRSRGE